MDKFTVIPKIKRSMKKDKKITQDQIYDYNRRVERSPVLRVHVELLQQAENQRIRDKDKLKELRAELEDYKQGLSVWKSNYEYSKKRLIDEWGVKSYEYEVVYGLCPK